VCVLRPRSVHSDYACRHPQLHARASRSDAAKVTFPRGLAVVVVALLAFAAIFALGTLMARDVTQLAGDLPRYQATISAKIQRFSGSGERGTAGILRRTEEVIEDLNKEISKAQPAQAWIPVEVHEPSGGPFQTLSRLITPLLSPLAMTGLIVVFVIFILIQREDLRNRLIRLAGSTDIPHTTAAIDDAAHRLSRLFLTQLIINSGFAIIIGLGLWRIGVPSPFLWGILAGILRFIPYIGSILGLVFPVVLALSVDPGWSMVLWTLALFLSLEALTSQVVEPVFVGHSTGLSPVAVVLSATFWAWLWGPIGLVLATPLTVMLVVLGRHIEAFKFLEILLGVEPALSDAENFYQRMLARDPIEAVEQAKSFIPFPIIAMKLPGQRSYWHKRTSIAACSRKIKRGFFARPLTTCSLTSLTSTGSPEKKTMQ
jgi:predicted PurR-regulated permease PerM